MKETVVRLKNQNRLTFEKSDISSEKISSRLTLLTLESFVLCDGQFYSGTKCMTGPKDV